jgi:hypothetical protein
VRVKRAEGGGQKGAKRRVRGKKERGVYITSQNYVFFISINCRLLKKIKIKMK